MEEMGRSWGTHNALVALVDASGGDRRAAPSAAAGSGDGLGAMKMGGSAASTADLAFLLRDC